MKIAPLLLAVAAIAAACGSEPKTASVPAAAGSSARLDSAAQAVPAVASTTYQRLQGKWQSTTDAKSVIEIKGHQYIDFYNGKQLGATAFILDGGCPGAAGAGHPGDNGKYLVQPRENMCWEVVGVNEKGLELSYTARGNTLNYRRLK